MAFEMKYDKDGQPITPKEQPKIEEPKNEEAQVTLFEQPTESMVENQGEINDSTVENDEQEQKPEPVKVDSGKKAEQSWRELREKAEQAQRERDEAVRILKEIQERQNAKANQPEPEEDLSVNVEEDALVEGKHLSKVNKQIKKLEQQLKQYEQQASLNSTEAKLKNQYPDFDSIVTKENLDAFRTSYPEIASTINASQDIYAKAVSAYTMIKKLGIAAPQDTFLEDKITAQRNASKPKPLASVAPSGSSDSPLNRANAFASGKLTEELQKTLLKEMQEARKGY